MPRKTKTDTTVLQNRESQRRSRARRRELVEDLQRRVAEYERRDARATEAMQVAARRVVEENRRLRGLLGRVDGSGGEGRSPRQEESAEESKQDRCQGFGKEGCCADEEVEQKDNSVSTSTSLETSCEEAVEILRELQKGRHIDTEQVRTALGCPTAETCLVKNTRLFQVMDELS
ncbi:hypothetical protein QBC34DRAFT_429412 [Podospora aff. communis PSN243]|uniref:BZIP domain-containing protein n=1 Tax=Podospora aff. communis PSN243 TaxID=3040156 RepID=A0AAV9GCU0_9PEZI|nr:hypothetical protein QBC34DRAFT_429412 [Podospora aff. communis PSN243]